MADQDQHQAKRFSVDAEVMVGSPRMSVLLTARMFEAGMEGCAVRFAAAVDFEVRSTVEMLLKIGQATISSLGTVERVEEAGLAVELSFKQMGERATREWQEWLARLEAAEVKSEPVAVTAEPAAAKIGSTERKKAEKPPCKANMLPVEPMRLRKDDRHSFRSPVWIAPVGSMRRFEGTTEDLSTGGCQIRLQTATELAVGREMEMWLQSSSGMFRVKGYLRRRIEDDCGIGLEFDRANARGAREVDRLIAGCIRAEVEAGRRLSAPRVEDRVAA
jgi:hypothetical protein